MSIKEYLHVILGVLTNLKVIGTVVVCLLVIEFARFITTYRKRPPRPKKVKAAPAAAAPAEEAPAEAQESEE